MTDDNETVDMLRRRYAALHPLLFHRSLEKAASPGELFDILDTVPARYPVTWNDETRRWEHVNDLTLSHAFDFTVTEKG